MIRLLVWFAGALGFLYVISHFGYWREAIAFAVLAAAFMWIVGGGLWVVRGPGHRAQIPGRIPADAAAMKEAARRAEQTQRRPGVPL